MNNLLTSKEIFDLIQIIDDVKLQKCATDMLIAYSADLHGYFVDADGKFTPAFDEANWGNNGSLVHRLLQGPERHGDVDGSLFEFYLSEGYLSKCSDWLREMSPAVLREIEEQMWH